MSSPQNISDAKKTPGQYFNNYYLPERTVSTNQSNAIIGFFEQYTGGNKLAAQSIASAVIFTAIAQNMDPMAVLTDFIGIPKPKLTSYLAMFLNLNRVGTSLLGLTNVPAANKYVQRAILP